VDKRTCYLEPLENKSPWLAEKRRKERNRKGNGSLFGDQSVVGQPAVDTRATEPYSHARAGTPGPWLPTVADNAWPPIRGIFHLTPSNEDGLHRTPTLLGGRLYI
jgi:hypothetical protein